MLVGCPTAMVAMDTAEPLCRPPLSPSAGGDEEREGMRVAGAMTYGGRFPHAPGWGLTSSF